MNDFMRINEDVFYYIIFEGNCFEVIMIYLYFINLMLVFLLLWVLVLFKMLKNIKYIIIYVNVILLDKFFINF